MAINNTIRTITADNIEGIVAPHNYVTSSFENGTITGWSLFNTTLTSGLPTGSIGAGAASLTLGTTTTNALSGSYSLQMVGAGVVTAGQGFISDVFSVNRESYAKILTFKAAYEVASGASNANFSGTLGSQSFAWYLYDVTNSAWVQPAGFLGMNQSSGSGIVSGTFQTNASGNQYRLACICLQATAGAITINFDNISVGPQTAPIGMPASDLTVGTSITIGATTTAPTKGTVVTDLIQWQRRGDLARIVMQYKQSALGAAASGTGDYLFTLPNGMSFDSTKVTYYTADINASNPKIPIGLGSASTYWGTGNSASFGVVVPYDATRFRLLTMYNATNGTAAASDKKFVGSTYYQTSLTGGDMGYTADFWAPIAGWSSNVQMSNDTDTRIVAARYSLSASQSIPNATNTTVVWNSKTFDSHAGMNTSTGLYTIPVTGYYEWKFGCRWASNATGIRYSSIIINGVGGTQAYNVFGTNNDSVTNTTSDVKLFNAGDTIGVQVFQNSGGALAQVGGTGADAYFTIQRLSGPSVIAASESVNCKYTSSTTAVGTSLAVVVYPTKVYDTHNAYNTTTGLYTAPVSGKYRLTAQINQDSGSSSTSVNAGTYMVAFVNGVQREALYNYRFPVASTAMALTFQGSTTVSLNAGDTIAAYIGRDAPVSAFSLGGTVSNFVAIERVGN